MRVSAATVVLLPVLLGGCDDTPSIVGPGNTAPVRYQGTVVLPETWSADLDQGTLRSDTAADVQFEVVSDTARYLTPVGATQLALFGNIPPGKSGCLATTLSSEPIDLKYLPEGSFLCAVTGGGRIAQLEVVESPGPSPGSLVLGVKTFALAGTDTTVNPPALLSPPDDFVVHQFEHATFCEGDIYGFSIDYRWAAVPGAERYEIYVKHPGAPIALFNNRVVLDTTFLDLGCGDYVASGYASNWRWRVTVVFEDGTRLTSLTGRYHFTDPFQP